MLKDGSPQNQDLDHNRARIPSIKATACADHS